MLERIQLFKGQLFQKLLYNIFGQHGNWETRLNPIFSLTKTTPQRRRCLITQNTKRLSFDGLFRRLHSKSLSSPKSDLNLKRAFDDSVLNTATSRMHRPTEEQQKYFKIFKEASFKTKKLLENQQSEENPEEKPT